MFPYSYNPYGAASYNPSDAEYLRALAEEQAARQAYTEAVRAQAEARTRAARARQQRQAYERPYSAYFSDEDEDDSSGSGSYHRGRPSYGFSPSRGFFEDQRRRELEQRRRQEALELERAQEQEKTRQLEEEQRMRMLEEEKRRQAMREDELRRRTEAEQRGREMRRRLQEEYRRRQSLSPLEHLLGLRPSRSMQSDSEVCATQFSYIQISNLYRSRSALAERGRRRLLSCGAHSQHLPHPLLCARQPHTHPRRHHPR